MKRASSTSQPFPPEKNPSRFHARLPVGAAVCAGGAAALPKTRSVRTTTPGLSPGETYSAVLGRAAGRHVPAWVSVGLCIPSSPPHPPHPPPPWPPQGAPWQYQVLCSTGSLRWEISCASLGCDDGIFFLPRSHRCLVCSPSTKRICKGIPQNTQNSHLHILLTESVLSFQLIASYDFFYIINII